MADLSFFNGKKIWIAGHKGLVGSAILRKLIDADCEIITVDKSSCDLRNRDAVAEFYKTRKPHIVIMAAARVGGIKANRDYPVEFLEDNLAIAQNTISEAYKADVRKLVFLGSSCIYPKLAEQPIREDALLSGPLEPTNEAYALAKIAGVKLCEFYRRQYGSDFISVMPCNLYGPNDRWNDENAHVIPSLISKIHAAKQDGRDAVTIWGTGRALREFMHADDAASAILHCTEFYSGAAPINIGTGAEISIYDLAMLVAQIIGFNGQLYFDTSMPDGTPRKCLDNSKIAALGWKAEISLLEGLQRIYVDFLRVQSCYDRGMNQNNQSTNHIMMMEPVAFHSNPETMATNTYQYEDPLNLASMQREAVREFRTLRDILIEKGIIVTTTLGQVGSPDDIFCNNWVATFGDGTLAYYPMLAPNRQIERRPDMMRMLEGRYDIALDFSTYETQGKYLESTGAHWLDRVNKVAYFSLSARCNEELARLWCEKMGYEAVTFTTRNHSGIPVYHTDVMMFIGTGYAGICSACILEEDRARVLQKLSRYHQVVDLSLDQLRAFCGNSLELIGTDNRRHLVMSGSAYGALSEGQKHQLLQYVDEIVYSDIPTIEKYGGGSARCMLLELF